MKSLKSISAVLLAILVLVSSTSFVVNMHYCMGEVQNISLFSKADGCVKEQSIPPCHKPTTPPCCEDETVILKGSDFKTSITEIQFVTPASIEMVQEFLLIALIVPSSDISVDHSFNYDPPLPSVDITVRHQVFLI